MTLAIGLRRLMVKSIEDLNTKKSVLWRGNSCTKEKRGRPKRAHASSTNTTDVMGSQYNFEIVAGMSLEQLLPAPSKQKEVLNHMVLDLTMEEYNVKMQTLGHPQSNDNGAAGSSGLHGNSEHRIEANEREGVFSL